MKLDPVLFLGGNGHCAARLAAARRALLDRGSRFEILDPELPGFEGRPAAEGLEPFLDTVERSLSDVAKGARPTLYATGIGGLIALCLRARGSHLDVPLLLQAPVLWGLERRWMPRLMRRLPARRLLPLLFRTPAFQRRFARRHFARTPHAALLSSFFDGYARCSALGDLFDWMGPALLRRLEAALRGRPERLSGITVWWGGRDTVVTMQELRFTEHALGHVFPLRVFADWGHYPMIDCPEAWVEALEERP